MSVGHVKLYIQTTKGNKMLDVIFALQEAQTKGMWDEDARAIAGQVIAERFVASEDQLIQMLMDMVRHAVATGITEASVILTNDEQKMEIGKTLEMIREMEE
jgi:hypothetical protein